MKKSVKGQATIFIIIAIVLVLVIVLFFVFKGKLGISSSGFDAEQNPSAYLTNCLEDDVRNVLNEIMPQGGYVSNPLNKTFIYNGEIFSDISYLCYARLDGQKCKNQESDLMGHFEEEVKNQISPTVQECFQDYLNSLGNAGFSLSAESENPRFSLFLENEKLVIEIKSDLTYSKNEETRKIGSIKIGIKTQAYEILKVVREIVNAEASKCGFDYNQYMLSNRNIEIKHKKINSPEYFEFYEVKELNTGEIFRFLVRGECL